MKTLADAIDEYNAVSEEAVEVLAGVTDEVEGTVIWQLLCLAAASLMTCQENDQKMSAAIAALSAPVGASVPTVDPRSTPVPEGPQEAAEAV